MNRSSTMALVATLLICSAGACTPRYSQIPRYNPTPRPAPPPSPEEASLPQIVAAPQPPPPPPAASVEPAAAAAAAVLPAAVAAPTPAVARDAKAVLATVPQPIQVQPRATEEGPAGYDATTDEYRFPERRDATPAVPVTDGGQPIRY
ncbi:MAG: hypothetical protein ACI8TX_003705 [Hyphomicrobiaceae bacterium]|jgi:hypothetical protein